MAGLLGTPKGRAPPRSQEPSASPGQDGAADGAELPSCWTGLEAPGAPQTRSPRLPLPLLLEGGVAL